MHVVDDRSNLSPAVARWGGAAATCTETRGSSAFFKKVKPSQLRKPFEAVRRRVVREKNAAYIIAVLKVTVGPEHGANGI